MEFMTDLGSNVDAYRPSLFELIAQEKMGTMLQPAIKYVLTVYAQRYPRYLLRLVNNYEEFYTLMMIFVERHYLKEWGSSFAENFYGLKRERVASGLPLRNMKGLSSRDVRWSVFSLVCLPYIKIKLDDLYERISGGTAAALFGEDIASDFEDEERNPAKRYERQTFRERVQTMTKRVFRRTYPYLNAAWHGSALLYYIAYLYDRTPFYTPWLHLFGIQIRRMSMKDYREHAQREKSTSRSFPSLSSNLSRPEFARQIVIALLTRGFDFLKVLLPMSIFFFKFLEWWYASEFSKGSDQNPLPPPPEILKPSPLGIPLPADRMICALCEKRRTNASMLPSGYVFCYPCVYRYVEEEGRCPVTRMKVGKEDVRKIYSVSV